MSNIGAQKKREQRDADATRPVPQAREVLYRFRRERGGLVVEEVSAADVKVTKRLSHDVYDIAIAAFSASLHKRLT